MRRLAALIAPLATAAAFAGPAVASPVVVVGTSGHSTVEDDPALPAPSAAELIAPGAWRPASAPCGTSLRVAPTAAAAATRTTLGELSRIARAGAITEDQRAAYEATYRHARTVRGRLGGWRGAELGSVIATVDAIARRGLLTSSRLPALLLSVQRNAEFWPTGKLPQAAQPKKQPCAGKAGLGGARVQFAGDRAVVFQWYPGQGLQFQPLASFGKLNADAAKCMPAAPPAGGPCNAPALRAGLDRMVALASDRGGFLAWEYDFAFGGGVAPWISGLAQGTGIQALTHGSLALGDPKYLRSARRALGAFTHAPPVGVRVRTGVGSHYLIYSFAPGTRVLNGFLQSLNGLFDYATAAKDASAMALFASGDREARREVPRFDTGAWSRYSQGGAESDLGYHELVRDFLRGLCSRTHAGVYCTYANRFTAYLAAPSHLRITAISPRRARRTAVVRLTLSKISCVTMTVTRAGRAIASVSSVLSGGTHTLGFTPPAAGRYTVALDARDLSDHHTIVQSVVDVAAASSRG